MESYWRFPLWDLCQKNGQYARLLTVVPSLAVTFAAYESGASGGELVYKHDAASAYIDANSDSTSSEDDDYENNQDMSETNSQNSINRQSDCRNGVIRLSVPNS